MVDQQLLFDLFDAEESIPVLTRLEMQQSVLGFLTSLSPDGIGVGVPARFAKYRVAAGAFWCIDARKGRTVKTTALVDIYTQKAHCLSDCSNQQQLLDAVKQLRSDMEVQEAIIRQTEPELKSCDDLFSEYSTWDYRHSANPEYHRLRARLERIQSALYKGSRLERIRNAAVADLLYLAVPENLILPDELVDGWGLIYLNKNRSFTVVKAPEPQDGITAERRMHFALNIGASTRKALLFAHGVNLRADGGYCCTRLPKRRRK